MRTSEADLAIELIARYQPVATDLRFIRSCMEIAFGFSRYGRYSFDIVEVLETIGPVTECEKGAVLMMANTVREMILLSINGLQARDKTIAEKLYELDDTVDSYISNFFKEPFTTYPRKREGGQNDKCINNQFRS
jgi:phosphate transport system protein